MSDVDVEAMDLPSVVGEGRHGKEYLTEFIFFLLRDHVPATVIEKAMMDSFSRPQVLESFPELKAYAESVAAHLLGRD